MRPSPLRFVEYTSALPEENLALDETLLDAVEAGEAPDTLRLWESPARFAVIGTAQALAEEVDLAACAEDGVPVLRRCSAGGCVLQGPGCLNFSLALSYRRDEAYRSIRGAYCRILKDAAAALAALGAPVTLEGISDLALDGRKVSGNAQKRRRYAFLHHGTLLYEVDAAAMARYLREPADRPAYRGGRRHEAFVGVLPLTPGQLREAMQRAFKAPGPPEAPTPEELERARALAVSKYLDPAWTRRR